jgi:hypothetical protein
MQKLKLVLQPEGSSLCGQSCVAMIAGISLSQSIKAIGHKRKTRWVELRDALTGLGFSVSEKLTKVQSRSDLPRFCVVRIYWGADNTSHWIIKCGGLTYDPISGLNCAEFLPFAKKPHVRVTSYGEIH